MASRQATTALIRTADFRNNAISFPVESVLGIGQGTGHLLIEASAGYVLTTPTNINPQPSQSIPYVLQPNGTHVAHAVVTLLATELPLMQGTVTLRNPVGETSILPIAAETNTDLWDNSPVLTLSTETLTFAKTGPGEEEYALLKIAQQGTDMLITLTSDDPANFLIAIGVEELRFTSTISFVPAPAGTFVHVRYAPDRAGQHTARLFVETSFDTRTVLLRGRAAGLLPALPQRQPKPNRDTQSVNNAQPSGPGRLWRVMVLILAGGLAGLGYIYRCQLAPELCQSQASTTPVLPSEERIPVQTGRTDTNPTEEPSTTRKYTDDAEPAVSSKSTLRVNRKKAAEPIESIPPNEVVSVKEIKPKSAKADRKVLAGAEESTSVPARLTRKSVKAPVLPAAPAPTDESDLEKELNKKVDKPR